jgi:hypothetical protein
MGVSFFLPPMRSALWKKGCCIWAFRLVLAHCEREKDVIDLLKMEELWDDPSAWQYYGDNENNFATIGNQQRSPEVVLIEKIINSVDAVNGTVSNLD